MKLTRANDGKHKWVAEFKDGTKTKFGAVGMDDYTIKHDTAQRDRYLARHRSTEDWNDPQVSRCVVALDFVGRQHERPRQYANL